MLAPVGIVYNKVEDREAGQKQNRRPKKHNKQKKEKVTVPSQQEGEGDHIDLTA